MSNEPGVAMEAAEIQPPVPATRGASAAIKTLSRMPLTRQFGAMIGLAASVALGVMVALWSGTPTYSLLYASLEGQEASDVVQALEEDAIPFRVEEGNGAILVPSGQVRAVRLKLAAQGLPRGSDKGFEVLDRKQELGTSQFIERARYQRALEVELARSISTLNNVRSTRVHLAVPKQSAFMRDRRKPTASVLLDLYAGRSLEKGQVEAIAHLVSASVPSLEPNDVKVVDARGQLLGSRDGDSAMAFSDRQLAYTAELEAAYIERIENILMPILGADRMKAQVVADVDFTQSEETRESYNPDRSALRSEHLLEEQNLNAAAAGVPGALTNQPPPEAYAPEVVTGQVTNDGSDANGGAKRRQSTRNYELERTISHTRVPTSRLQRLSVAVVLDEHRSQDDSGAVTRSPRTPEELERITSLVKEAIGYDANRGDTVQVVSAAFTEPVAVEPLPEVALWKRPWVLDAAKYLAGGTFLLLIVVGVLRPFMRNLVQLDDPRGLLASPQALDREIHVASDVAGGRNATAQLTAPSNDFAGQVMALKGLASEDPKRMAQVVGSWVAEDE